MDTAIDLRVLSLLLSLSAMNSPYEHIFFVRPKNNVLGRLFCEYELELKHMKLKKNPF